MAGSLAIPNVFAGASPAAISKLDTDFSTIATYINAREISTGLLANRPAAGTAGAWYFATDSATLYMDNGSAWILVATATGISAETLSGLTLSNDGASPNTVLDIGAGAASSDDAVIGNRVLMTLAVFTKNMNAAWAVGSGNGGNNAGAALAATTWYEVFLIQRPDTGVVDVLCDTTLTPALPANYTKKRRIGSFKTDGASHILAFTQVGDLFTWSASVLDVSTTNPGVAAVTVSLASIPPRLPVIARCLVGAQNNGVANGEVSALFSALSQADEAPGGTNADLPLVENAAGRVIAAMAPKDLLTNTSGQVRYRLSFSDVNVLAYLRVFGWYDRRGRG